MEEWGFLESCRYLIHDRGTKFTDSFRAIVKSSQVEPLKLPARSPNLNAFAERWVKSVKDDCLSKLILFGETSLRHALRVGVELAFMPRWGAGPTRDSASAIGNHRSSQATLRARQQLPLAYLPQAKREHVSDCNNAGNHRAFSRDQESSKKVYDQDILFELFLLGVLQKGAIPELRGQS